jgi:hypothetical protein
MSDSKTYAKSVIIISDYPVREEAATEYTELLGRVTRESIFSVTKAKQKFIK